MKKIFLIIIALCAAISVSAFCLFASFSFNSTHIVSEQRIFGSGKIVTRTIDAPKFDAIDASRAVQVVITDQVSDKITIAADDNVIDLVVVKVKDGKLKITLAKELSSIQDPNVTVTVPVPKNRYIRSLEVSSVASIKCIAALAAPEFSIDASSAGNISVAIKTKKCSIDASSAAKINAAIDTESCDINASSFSKIELTGSAKSCTADLSSAATLSADSFVVENYHVGASSGSNATINCSKQLDASASSGAGIDYLGQTTQVEVSKSSGGRINRK